MLTEERIVVPAETTPPEPPEPRRASARDAFVTIAVCLSLWAVLAAPILQRSAEAGPVGARRTAALALLRPLVAVSDTLLLSRATSSVERALGRDPDGAPGGELVLPAFHLPPSESEPTPAPPPPAAPRSPKRPGRPHAAVTRRHPAEGPPAAANAIRTPTHSNKLRVAVIGDSLSQGLGPAIEQLDRTPT